MGSHLGPPPANAAPLRLLFSYRFAALPWRRADNLYWHGAGITVRNEGMTLSRRFLSMLSLLLSPTAVFIVPVLAERVVELDPYVVGPGPIIEEVRLTDSGTAVTRVGAEQLLALGAGDLSAALRRVPGVTISRYNVVGAFGGGDGGAVFIRGQGSGRPGAQIVTLTDGIPRFVGVWTHPLLDTLPTDFAASIEVFKSPQPARFGNMAFGAVDIRSARAVRPGWSGRARGEVGTWNTRALYGELAYLDESWNVHAAVSRRASDGHREEADGEVTAAQARVAWQGPSGWEWTLLVQAMDSAANDPEPVGVELPIVERYTIENQFYLLEAIRESESLRYGARAYVEAGDLDWRQWRVPPPPPFPAQALETLTDYGNHGLRAFLASTGEGLSWHAGFNADSYGGRVTEVFALAPNVVFGEERFHLMAPHLRFSVPFAGSAEAEWTASAGARGFFHDVFPGAIGWEASLQRQSGRTTLYVNAARGINYPGVFVSVFGRRPPPWNIGLDWRELEPEEVLHFEAGWHHRLDEGVQFNVAIFHDKVTDALRITPPPPVGGIVNLGEYTLKGAEATVQAGLGDGWTAFLGGTFLDADDDVPNVPEWSLTLGLDGRFEGLFDFGFDLQYVDAQRILDQRFANDRGEVDAYLLVNLRFSRELEWESVGARLFARVDNLFDEDYEHRPGYPMPGISATLGLEVTY